MQFWFLSLIFYFIYLFIFLRLQFSFQVLGESLHITMEYLTQEAKVASMKSRMEALEAENSKLKKDLIFAMDEANTLKEKVKTLSDDLRVEKQLTLEKEEHLLAAKEKLKTIAAKAVEAFQQIDEYNTVLFSWYFKGFELLRRYFVKHPIGVDLQNLDWEEVDKEMAADEASQSSAPEEDAPKSAPAGDDANNARTCPFFFLFFFLSELCVFGPFKSILRTISSF